MTETWDQMKARQKKNRDRLNAERIRMGRELTAEHHAEQAEYLERLNSMGLLQVDAAKLAGMTTSGFSACIRRRGIEWRVKDNGERGWQENWALRLIAAE